MKRGFALFTLALVLLMTMVPVVAFAAEAVVGDGFDPDQLIIGGVALAPLISIIISIVKGWTNLDRKYIPLINVILGTVAVLVVGVINEGMPLLNAVIMTLGVVLGSQVFHETFGHAAKIIAETFGKKPKEE
ncbi:MAG: hypothetical protein GX956_06175 [Firmicutes bacterium]|nr:hypothetical protein [Bacillota bacterium]